MTVGLTIEQMSNLSMERTIHAVDPLSTPPSTPGSLTVTARNLGFLVQWSKVDGVDGYNVIVSDTADMGNPLTQARVAGADTFEYFYNSGHVAVTRFFAVQTYKGNSFSEYTSPASATTVESKSSSSFPGNTTFTDTETEIATLTLTTTGGTIYVIGQATFSQNGADKSVAFKLKEDGVLLRTVNLIARNDVSTTGHQGTIFNFSTPAAGSHTYSMTADNLSDAATCTASSIGLLAMEVPLLVSAASPAPPTAPTPPKTPSDYPTGPEVPYRGGY